MASTLFDDLAAASERVASTTKRNDKVDALASTLRRLGPDEIIDAVAFLTGQNAIGRIGVGWATVADLRPAAVSTPSVTIAEVAATMRSVATMAGSGVTAARRDALGQLLARSTEREQRLLRGILTGEIRQGALDGVMQTAVAKAAGVPVAEIRRATMMAGDVGTAAVAALTGGSAALDAIRLEPGRPVQPMLASVAASAGSAVEEIGLASVEWKLDGARLQAHRRAGEIGLFTRNLNDITSRLPRVVEVVRSLPGGDLVLDGEVLGLVDDAELSGRGDDGSDAGDEVGSDDRTEPGLAAMSPQRFQDTMADFGADADAARGGDLRAFFFDVMHVDGTSVHDESLAVRRELLEEFVPVSSRLPSIVTADPLEADRFMERAVGLGHEGVMVKGVDERYEAGRRGKSWRKVKPVYTFDLVVLAIEWGSGRRRGKLSNLHLGARGADGSFVMVGKTFKGMTDEMLAWQTERFLGLEIGRGDTPDGEPVPSGSAHGVVHVEPVQVVEIAVDGAQRSTRYPGGVALRFARVKRYRHDKSAVDADSIEAVQAMLR